MIVVVQGDDPAAVCGDDTVTTLVVSEVTVYEPV